MEKFTKLNGVAAPLPIANIDTDQLIPKQFLKIIQRTGLGEKLFFDRRYDSTGAAAADFILNEPQYKTANILITGGNFGCGSSREHAVWALMDFGIRCVISTSFSDIFSGNASKNGLLAAIVSADNISKLFSELERSNSGELAINLEDQTISSGIGDPVSFIIDPYTKSKLLAGLDEITETLGFEEDITKYEKRRIADDPAFLPNTRE